MSLNKKYKNTPFKIPKRYFENFDAAFLHELELEKEIKETGFKIPDGYLNQFEDSASKAVKIRPIKTRNISYSLFISGIAATLMLFFMFSWPDNVRQEISFESVENYLIYEGIQTNELSNLLTLEELNNATELQLASFEIENYILENASVEILLLN